VPFIIDVTADFDGSGAKADVDVNVKVASTRITCPGETIAEDDSQVTFPNAAPVHRRPVDCASSVPCPSKRL